MPEQDDRPAGAPLSRGCSAGSLLRGGGATHGVGAINSVTGTISLTGPSMISVTAPDGRVYPYGVGGGHTHAIAGRGYYMLFLLNTSGVPSRAKFLRLV